MTNEFQPRLDLIKEYQNRLKQTLANVFLDVDIKTEWASMQNESSLQLYSPRLDVAVGPFANHMRLVEQYDKMCKNPKIRNFIARLIEFNRNNQALFPGYIYPPDLNQVINQNKNSRCFMAIEIENEVSRKHLIGGAINASALGRIGIVIPWSQEKLRAFVRLFRYLQYLKNAEKNSFYTTNLLIITKDQMREALEDFVSIEI